MPNRARQVIQEPGVAVRTVGHKSFQSFQRIARSVGNQHVQSPLTSVALWPPVATGADLAGLSARLRWFLPTACRIDIPASDGNVRSTASDMFDDEQQSVPENVRLHQSGDMPLDQDAILIWKHARRTELSPKVIRQLARMTIVDPSYLGLTEIDSYLDLSIESLSGSEMTQLREKSRHSLARLLELSTETSRVAVYGTGPSMMDVSPTDIGADLVIACNSAVRDRAWITAVKPRVIAFADPVFHFGPSRYASLFRSDLVRAVEIADAYVVTLDRFLPLVSRHMPEILDRTIALSPVRSGPLVIPSTDSMATSGSSNVLTLLMLPMAAALGREIVVVGCDGRQPSETYFWKHNTEGQYPDDLLTTVKKVHPSFFRDHNYARYYGEHSGFLEAQIEAIEHLGIGVSCATPSAIPALHSRMQHA